MAAAGTDDGSEDVNDFLRRIRELGEKRDREDNERTKKLEEDILEGRRQREVRRAERARSLSPEKQSPSTTPRSMRSPRVAPKPDVFATTPSLAAASTSKPLSMNAALDGTLDTPPTKLDRASPTSMLSDTNQELQRSASVITATPSPSTSASRPEVLSWQQRRGGTLRGPRSRPTSMVEREAAQPLPSDAVATTTVEDAKLSRAEIAKSLGSKDPTWFRQTSDRAGTSYPKSRNEAPTSEFASVARMKLPGMTQPSSEGLKDQISTSKSSPSGNRGAFSDTLETSPAASAAKSPMPLTTSQRFNPTDAAPGTSETQSFSDERPDSPEVSSVHGRLSPERMERPSSPTKGMGGFVQSAMLKRSDSLNKRWSAQAAPGLGRQDSTTSRRTNRSPLRGEFAGLQSSHSAPKLGPKPDFSEHDSSAERTSRPMSGFGNSVTSIRDSTSDNTFMSSDDLVNRRSIRSEGLSEASERAKVSEDNLHETSPPPSPSKRWSPLKSTWLESALSKPESPKVTPKPPTQLSWMSELQKTKKARAEGTLSVDEDMASASGRPLTPTDGNRNATAHTPMSEIKTATKSPPTRPKPFSLSKEFSNSAGAGDNQIQAAKEIVRPVDASSPISSPSKTASGSATLSNYSESKAKPLTTPKKDLKATLKSTQSMSPSKDSEDLEFRNVFGKLKRTNTEKYVAPDEFKGNILKGKAALNTTGGPQKSVIRDEFKESILERKQTMREKSSEDRPAHKPPIREGVKPELPEAILRSKTLIRKDNAPTGRGASTETPDTLSRSITKSRDLGSPASPAPLQTEVDDTPSTNQPTTSPVSSTSKLANRFNPGLASVLAKRPGPSNSGMASVANAIVPSTNFPADLHRSSNTTESKSGAPLQHMTKARARGPKRRGPTAKPDSSISTAGSSKVSTLDSTAAAYTPSRSTIPPTIKSSSNPIQSSFSSESSPSKPTTPAKSPRLVSKSESINRSSPSSLSPPLPSKPSALRSLDQSEMNTQSPRSTPDETATSSPKALIKDGISASQKPSTTITNSPRVKTPSKAPMTAVSYENTKPDLKEISKPTNLTPTPSSPTKRLIDSPFLAADRSNSLQQEAPSSVIAVKPRSEPLAQSPTRSTSKISNPVSELFDQNLVLPEKLHVDTQAILSGYSSDTKHIKTEKKQINELTGDGKLIPMPSNLEHILYNNCMYVCTHVFSGEKGPQSTEVYLWAGSSVSESTVEDAQLFARKIAKDNNGKLAILRQGKETSSFFQALGGILVTRSGSSTSNSKTYMLCGRKHLGHIAFDEVPMSLTNLCPGFPIIVATSTGKGFLWRGIGCNAEELGCARLIGMDLGVVDEIIEMEQGKEPTEFLSIFPRSAAKDARPPHDHWQLKPEQDNYRTRLFQVNDATPVASTITEIIPYTQEDLSPSNVYLLDAFFELYIIIGAQTRSKSAAFSTALLFAQEYGILAASTEDRPFVPATKVVIEGVPQGLTACFRVWDRRVLPTRTGKGGDIKIVSLEEAIAGVKPGQ